MAYNTTPNLTAARKLTSAIR